MGRSNSAMSRACRKAASHTSACGSGRIPPGTAAAESEASDEASEAEREERMKDFDRRMDQIMANSRIRSETFRRNLQGAKEEEVDSNNNSSSSCEFSIGSVIRPILRLAEIEVYRCGAICQVVGADTDGWTRVSYYEPNGKLSSDRCSVRTEHFEFACDAAVFVKNPHILHSTWEAVLNSNTADREGVESD